MGSEKCYPYNFPLIKWGIILLVVVVPVLALSVLVELGLGGGFAQRYELYVKAIKDIGVLFLGTLTAFFILMHLNSPINKLLLYFYFGLSALMTMSIINGVAIIGILTFAGLRPFLYTIFIYIGYAFFSKKDVTDLYKVMRVVFILFLISLAFEATVRTTWGLGIFGFSRRLTGFFFRPGPAGIFVVLFSYLHYLMTGKMRIIYINLPLMFFINSAVGWVLLFVLIYSVKYLSIRNIGRSFSVFPVLFVLVTYMYSFISYRPDFLESYTTRFKIFQDALNTAGPFGIYLGYGSDVFKTLTQHGVLDISTPHSETIYAAITNQFGWVGLVSFMALFLIISYKYKRSKISKELYILVIIIYVAGLGGIVYEFFPFNMIVFILCGHYLRAGAKTRGISSGPLSNRIEGGLTYGERPLQQWPDRVMLLNDRTHHSKG